MASHNAHWYRHPDPGLDEGRIWSVCYDRMVRCEISEIQKSVKTCLPQVGLSDGSQVRDSDNEGSMVSLDRNKIAIAS